PCARHDISTKWRYPRRSRLHFCLSAEGFRLRNLTDLAVAVRRESSTPEGPACGPAHYALAGGNHVIEESYAHARGTSLHGLCARDREAAGREARTSKVIARAAVPILETVS